MLSTYNGEKFLREQLDSLYAQEGVEIHILVRDDGSKDTTIKILEQYQQQYGRMTIHADENVGAAMSFHKLMAYAYKDFPDYEYYGFSDQDDVWLESKLSVAIKKLSENKGDIYYCNAFVTDENLNKQSVLGIKHNLNFPYLMFCQPALGCTQVMAKEYFNYCTEVFQKYLKENPPYIQLHDVWTMWISQMIGAKVVGDDDCYILYRQHSNNVTAHKKETAFQKTKRVSQRARKHKGHAFANFKILGRLIHDKLTPEALNILNKLYEYKKSAFKTIAFAIYMQKYFKSMFVKVMVMYRIIWRLY